MNWYPSNWYPSEDDGTVTVVPKNAREKHNIDILNSWAKEKKIERIKEQGVIVVEGERPV